MWGCVWQAAGPRRDPAQVWRPSAAQCCNGWEFGLQHQIRVGLSLGMSPQKIKGIFLQLIFYAGIPATVSSLAQAQRVIDEQPMWQREDSEPLMAEWLDSVAEKLERGRRMRREHWGPQAEAALENTLSTTWRPRPPRWLTPTTTARCGPAAT